MIRNNDENRNWSVRDLRSLVANHLTTEDLSHSRISSIIRRLRPGIAVKDGKIAEVEALSEFSRDSTPQGSIEACKSIVEMYSRSVARVEVKLDNEQYHPIGTCFIVSTSNSVRMATAGHLLMDILKPGHSIERSRPLQPEDAQREVRVNFHDSDADNPDDIYTVRKPFIWAHPRWDLLLFDLEAASEEFVQRPPLPLEKDVDWWQGEDKNGICVLGYPMQRGGGPRRVFDSTFKGPLEIKRISPGYCERPESNTLPPPREVEDVSTIERDKSTIDHDASTLRGSSGSPVFSLTSEKVIGLHYDGGEFHRSRIRPPRDPNNAVNIPVALLEDALLAAMTQAEQPANPQAPINWIPDKPAWSGASNLEKNELSTKTVLPSAGSAILSSVVADRPDFRDRIYRPSLLKAGDTLMPPEQGVLRIRDQAGTPACTAYAVATAVNIQLHELERGTEPVSEQMLYAIATLHDEWIDDSEGGSSLRGAIKGFYQYGVCFESTAPFTTGGHYWSLSRKAALQARSVTLGAYYRLQPDLLDFQLALNEARAIVVSARIHSGWISAKGRKHGRIAVQGKTIGAHAFVIVGYDSEGFIIQNSWGEHWCTWNGRPGLAHWHYDDWAENLIDAWVLRLAPSAPEAFDLVPRVASQHELLKADNSETVQLPMLPRPRRFSLIGHVCQIERDRFSTDGRMGIGLEALRETAVYLSSKSAREKYPKIAFFFHDPLLGRQNISKLCAWMIKPFKEHGIYPIHVVYGLDEALTIELRVKHECELIKSRFGAVEDDLSIYIERRLSQLLLPLINTFRNGISETAQSGQPLWQVLASIALESGDERQFSVFASGIGYCLVEQLGYYISTEIYGSKNQYNDSPSPLFNSSLAQLFLLAPSATLDMIEQLDYFFESIEVCTLANQKTQSTQLPGYYGDWIDLTARVTGLHNIGKTPTRLARSEHPLIKKQADSDTLLNASADPEVMNRCLKMFTTTKKQKTKNKKKFIRKSAFK